MKNKLIISSTFAVTILLLAGISPVVGYNSVESSAKDSPLFSVRTRRAINEDENALTCNYVGKYKGIDILFPNRDNNAVLFQRLIDGISRMNDVVFNRFIGLVINRLKKDDTIGEENIGEVVDALKWLRTNLNEINDFLINAEDDGWTESSGYSVDAQWKPGCLIYFMISFLIACFRWFGFLITFAIYTVIHSDEPSWCHPATCMCI